MCSLNGDALGFLGLLPNKFIFILPRFIRFIDQLLLMDPSLHLPYTLHLFHQNLLKRLNSLLNMVSQNRIRQVAVLLLIDRYPSKQQILSAFRSLEHLFLPGKVLFFVRVAGI